MFLPPHSTTEQVSLKKVTTTAPLVSGLKLDTEETSKQKKLQQMEGPALAVTSAIDKNALVSIDYNGRSL